MREVAVTATVTVDERAYYGRPCGDGFAVVTPDGVVTELDSRLREVRRFDLGGPVVDFSVTGTRWAWVVDKQLWVDGVPASLPGEAACRWLPSGDALWSAHGTGDEVIVELRTPNNEVTRTVTVPDEFGDSMVMLCEHPHADAVVLWVAAGQDGQQSWLIRDNDASLVADDGLPALFGPDGTWLLAAGDDGITRRSWPAGTELGTLNWAEIDPEAEEDGYDAPGADLMLLPGGFAAWSTSSGRLRTIDLTTMSVTDEFALAGHPVRTVAELYPILADDHNPCGDFGYSIRGANGMVLTVHQQRTLVLSALRDWSPSHDRRI
jgi:hypothetical protein